MADAQGAKRGLVACLFSPPSAACLPTNWAIHSAAIPFKFTRHRCAPQFQGGNQHVRHRRLYRAAGSGTHSRRRPAPPRISRLRQRRPGDPHRARICICANAPAASPSSPSSCTDRPAPGCHGISHTRWATHGPATDRNAHPHLGGDGSIAVVHNGVIENYAVLKRQLQAEGVHFHSDTDTEVIAQLIAQHYQGDLVEAVRNVLHLLKGTYGLAVVSPHQPDLLVGARLGSPLVVGIGDGRKFPRQRSERPGRQYAEGRLSAGSARCAS